jgi:hypothetical protein
MKAVLPALIFVTLFVQISLSQKEIPESRAEPVSLKNNTKLFKSSALKLRFEYPEGLEAEEWVNIAALSLRLNPSGSRQSVLLITNETKSDGYSAYLAKLIYKRLKRTKRGETINSDGLNGWLYTREENARIAGYPAYKAVATFDPSQFKNKDKPSDGRGMGPRYGWYFYFKSGKQLWSITCSGNSKEDLERFIPIIETVVKSLKFDK